jgi:hypothetical protein
MAKMVAIGAATALVVAVVMRPLFCIVGALVARAPSTLLFRPHFHPSLEGDEGVSPEALEVRPQRRKRLRIDGVQAARALGVVGDQVGALEHPEMLGNGGTGHREFPGEFADGQGPLLYETSKNCPPRAITECVELADWLVFTYGKYVLTTNAKSSQDVTLLK